MYFNRGKKERLGKELLFIAAITFVITGTGLFHGGSTRVNVTIIGEKGEKCI